MIKTRQIRPPVKIHGGKYYLVRCRRPELPGGLIGLFPPHERYLEPFVGGGSALLNKPRAALEIINDVDSDLVCMWRTLARDGFDVRQRLAETPYSEAMFDAAGHILADPDAGRLLRVAAYIVRRRFSRGGTGKSFAWSERTRGGKPGDVNAWGTFRDVDLPAIIERMQGVSVLNQDGRTILRMAGAGDFVYCDPPYMLETRTARKVYAHEVAGDVVEDRHWHGTLLDACREASDRGAKVLISGYRSPLYDDNLADWGRIDVPMPNHSGQGKTKEPRIESLWLNYDLENSQVTR